MPIVQFALIAALVVCVPLAVIAGGMLMLVCLFSGDDDVDE